MDVSGQSLVSKVELKSGDWKSLAELVTGQSLKESQKKRDLVQAELDFLDEIEMLQKKKKTGTETGSAAESQTSGSEAKIPTKSQAAKSPTQGQVGASPERDLAA